MDSYSASYVVGNENTAGILGVRTSEAGDEVVSIATGSFQKYAYQAAIQAQVKISADAQSETVLAQVRSAVAQGLSLPFPLPDQDLTAAAETLQFMVFRDAGSDVQQVAVIDEQGGRVVVRTVDDEIQTLADQALVSGSFWQGGKLRIEEHLELGSPFLDFCVLGMAETLSMPQFKRPGVKISLVVGFDGQLQKQFTKDGNRLVAGYLPSTSDVASSAKDRDVLDVVAKKIGDDIAARLIARGLPPLERRYEPLVRAEDIRRNRDLVGKYAMQASHLIIVELSRQVNGKDRVSVRLLDTATSTVIWTANDGAAMVPNRNWKRFILHSGVPAVARFRSPEIRDQFLTRLQTAERQILPAGTGGVIVIHEGNSGDQVMLRSLFGTKIWKGKASEVEITAIPSAPDADLSEILADDLTSQILPYVVYRLARHISPPAARIQLPEKIEIPLHLQLGLGSGSRIMPANRFRLQFAEADGEIRMNQPFLAMVTDVIDAQSCRIFLPAMPALQTVGAVDGIAICDSWPQHTCGVYFPFINVTALNLKNEERLLRAKRDGAEFGRHLQTALVQNFADRLDSTKGSYEFRRPGDENALNWEDKIDSDKTCAVAAKRGITHGIKSTIESKGNFRFRIRIAVQELKQTGSNTWAPGETLDSCYLQLRRGDF